jgi:hypothetical protein
MKTRSRSNSEAEMHKMLKAVKRGAVDSDESEDSGLD